MFDCLKGLIGFTQGNECIGELPQGMQYNPATGVYLDEHKAFIAAIITKGNGFWKEDNWKTLELADREARKMLGQAILEKMYTKVDATQSTLTVEIGELTGNGYLNDFNTPADMQIITKNVPDATFYLTHMSIAATLLTGPQVVPVRMYKNGMPVKEFQVTSYGSDDTRSPLTVPEIILLDGSTYDFRYNFNGNMFPVRNDMDCGCNDRKNAFSCFFQPFAGDGGGLRMLGEVRCNELMWPCIATQGGAAGLAAAEAYRAAMLYDLFSRLATATNQMVSGITLLKGEQFKPAIEALGNEFASQVESFIAKWNPSGSCCYEKKTNSFIGTGT